MSASCHPEMKDADVVQTFQMKQASTCFDLLYKRYAPKIYAKCISMLKDEAMAHDATQEIFTKVFMNLVGFSGRSQFSTWVYSITYNYCVDFLRRKKKWVETPTEDIERAGDDLEDNAYDESLLQMEIHQLKTVLENLSESDRLVLLLKYQDDMPIREIAESQGKSESAIKMQLLRAKEKALRIREELFPDIE